MLTILNNYQDKIGRIYSREELTVAVSAYLKLPPFGCLGFIMEPTIPLDQVSHIWNKLTLDDAGNLFGVYTPLYTPQGEILQELLNENKIVTSLWRAVGMVDKENKVSEMKIISIDLFLV